MAQNGRTAARLPLVQQIQQRLQRLPAIHHHHLGTRRRHQTPHLRRALRSQTRQRLPGGRDAQPGRYRRERLTPVSARQQTTRPAPHIRRQRRLHRRRQLQTMPLKLTAAARPAKQHPLRAQQHRLRVTAEKHLRRLGRVAVAVVAERQQHAVPARRQLPNRQLRDLCLIRIAQIAHRQPHYAAPTAPQGPRRRRRPIPQRRDGRVNPGARRLRHPRLRTAVDIAGDQRGADAGHPRHVLERAGRRPDLRLSTRSHAPIIRVVISESIQLIPCIQHMNPCIIIFEIN